MIPTRILIKVTFKHLKMKNISNPLTYQISNNAVRWQLSLALSRNSFPSILSCLPTCNMRSNLKMNKIKMKTLITRVVNSTQTNFLKQTKYLKKMMTMKIMSIELAGQGFKVIISIMSKSSSQIQIVLKMTLSRPNIRHTLLKNKHLIYQNLRLLVQK